MNLCDHGITVLRGAVNDDGYLKDINAKLYEWVERKNLKHNRTDSCLHHLLVYDKMMFNKILAILGSNDEIVRYFRTGFIMHSCGAVINRPRQSAYTHNWHIDTYEETNENVMLNVLIPLVDFTIANGCTKIYPSGAAEYREMELSKGDILLFNSGLRHCTGNNTTTSDRNCLTITLVKMYMKPQFDYLSLFTPEELEALDNDIRTLLNYHSQIPSNLTDFYGKKFVMLYKD